MTTETTLDSLGLDWDYEPPCECYKATGEPAEYVMTRRCKRCTDTRRVLSCHLHYLGALNRPGSVLCCVCGDLGSLTDFLIERRCVCP